MLETLKNSKQIILKIIFCVNYFTFQITFRERGFKVVIHTTYNA